MPKKINVLLVVPPTYEDIYGNSFIRAGVNPAYMVLSYPVISGLLRNESYFVKVADLNATVSPRANFEAILKESPWDIIGFNVTTPIFKKVEEYSRIAKNILPKSTIVAGGPHVSVAAEEVLRSSCVDIAVIGEGDFSFKMVVDGEHLNSIPGIAYLNNGVFNANPSSNIDNLDDLPMPYMEVLDSKSYVHPRLVSRRNPVASMESSRGCFGRCIFCNKSVFGPKIRFKSEKRVLEEMKYILSLGYKEIHLVDDLFTANLPRAKAICESLIRSELDLSWMPRGGIRVDTVDQELFYLLKRSGCWRVAFGIESGNQAILDKCNKKITLAQIKNAVSMARKAGLETEGYFMLGLPGETEDTLKETLKFSQSLYLDYAKFAITVPLPGTELFEEWDRMKLIKTKDWSKYTFSSKPSSLYEHPTVPWKVLDDFYSKSHRNFYFNFSYIMRRLPKSILTGLIFEDIKTFLKINLS
ncbi:MAG: radical SAM protein [Candidatus Omnitrophica bacterium]|nr:radical SAM protein [Candidatus Omnitrophota bacterium]